MTNVFFNQLSLKKALRFSPIFIFRFCRDKVAKNKNCELIPSSRQFCTWCLQSKVKKISSQIWWCYIDLIPIRLFFKQWNVFLPSKKQILICIWFHTQLSPNKIKRTPITNCLSHVESILFTSRYFLLWDTFFCSERL